MSIICLSGVGLSNADFLAMTQYVGVRPVVDLVANGVPVDGAAAVVPGPGLVADVPDPAVGPNPGPNRGPEVAPEDHGDVVMGEAPPGPGDAPRTWTGLRVSSSITEDFAAKKSADLR